MNNVNATALIDGCRRELTRIEGVKSTFGSTSPAMELMTKYSVIKCCGTIEQCFKIIIFDYFSANSASQATKYIEETFRKSSMNPNLNNIIKTLARFDDDWKDDFKSKVNALTGAKRIKASLASLNTNRNKFAHGGNTTVSFDQVSDYFDDACEVIKVLDMVV